MDECAWECTRDPECVFFFYSEDGFSSDTDCFWDLEAFDEELLSCGSENAYSMGWRKGGVSLCERGVGYADDKEVIEM